MATLKDQNRELNSEDSQKKPAKKSLNQRCVFVLHLLVHHGRVVHFVLAAAGGDVDAARVGDAVSLNAKASPVGGTVRATAFQLRSHTHSGESTRPMAAAAAAALRSCTYVHLQFVHGGPELFGSVLVVGNHVGQAVLDDDVELRGTRNTGGQTHIADIARYADTRGPHLVPEDVSGDGGGDLDDDHQRQQDGKLEGRKEKKKQNGGVIHANTAAAAGARSVGEAPW